MSEAKTALLSAYNKTEGLRAFAAALVERNWDLLASSGTKKFLDGYGVPSKDVAGIVGPPILGHRVVTLAREIYAALLSRPSVEDEAELDRIGVSRIDLVYVDLYPLADELALQAKKLASLVEVTPETLEEAQDAVIEKIDIGGPTLLRAAAKGGRYALCDEALFAQVLADIDAKNSGEGELGVIESLAAAAERKVAKYAALSAGFYTSIADGTFPKKWAS